MNVQRDFLLVATLAAATAAPVFGQSVAPTVGAANSGKESTASIPDISGRWIHPSIPGFEPLSSGPTSVVNRSRRNGTGNINQLVGDYTNPILKPGAAEVLKKHGEIMLSGAGYPDPRNQCTPQGVPYVFSSGGMQLLQQPDKITIIYEHDDDHREVRMNQSHPAKVIPSIHGDSVGHYEGDTLVIDTVGVELRQGYAMIDRFGTPYTKALHVVERYRLIDYAAAKEAQDRAEKEWPRVGDTVDRSYRGKGLQLEFRVEDPGVFTMPWSATITYLRAARTAWEERICAENIQHYYDLIYYSDKAAHVPMAGKPDF